MAIAEAWNGLTEFTVGRRLMVLNNLEIAYFYTNEYDYAKYVILFNSEELANKSIELHKELWEMYYCL